tara:strand:+ start:2810 stop:3004 length:195 start_codon:yes stop_codon:yes gene_type:complete
MSKLSNELKQEKIRYDTERMKDPYLDYLAENTEFLKTEFIEHYFDEFEEYCKEAYVDYKDLEDL